MTTDSPSDLPPDVAIVLCVRVAEYPEPTDGLKAEVSECYRCHEKVWVADNTLTTLAQENIYVYVVVCNQCDHADGDDLILPPEQIDKLHDLGMTDEDIARTITVLVLGDGADLQTMLAEYAKHLATLHTHARRN